MADIRSEISLFLSRKRDTGERARQRAALFLISGIDLDDALREAGDARRRTIVRLQRLLERERLKGVRRHWSYDLNRHIALKQALDALRSITDTVRPAATAAQKRRRTRRRLKFSRTQGHTREEACSRTADDRPPA